MNLALFDLDNTLLSGDSDFEWGQFLIGQGRVEPEIWSAKNQAFYEEYQAGVLDIDAFLAFQLAPLARYSRGDLERWHQEFMEAHIRPRIGEAARQQVEVHQRSGDLCALVTATNSFITGPIAREFGISHLIATVPEWDGQRFTGAARGTPAFREGKITRVDAWLESLGLWRGGFPRSFFYSDSQNDLPLLSAVTDPVAVDPDPVLAAHAQKMGWKIIRLRNG